MLSKYGASYTLFALGFLDHALGERLKLIGKIAMRDLAGLLAKRYLWRFCEVWQEGLSEISKNPYFANPTRSY